MRDELFDGQIFYSLKEAQILIEMWRKHYKMVKPHSSLGYRPPSPATVVIKPSQIKYISRTLWLVHILGADQYPPYDYHSCNLEKLRINQTNINQYGFLCRVSWYLDLSPDNYQVTNVGCHRAQKCKHSKRLPVDPKLSIHAISFS